jgi:hypothetical protein
MPKLTRRSAIAGLAGSALGGGCASIIDPIDPNDPQLTDPNTPFTADVHSHVFNAADLQIKLFFDEVIALDKPELRVFGPLLGALGDFAPTAKDENEALDTLEGAANSHNHGMVQAAARQLREERYQYARWKLEKAYWNVYGPAAPRYQPRGVTSAAAQARYEAAGARLKYNIDSLKAPNYTTFRANHRAALKATAVVSAPSAAAGQSGLGVTVDGAFAFLMRNFQYRYVNVHDYLEEYSSGPRRKIDLMVTTNIDYDWPLGSKTGTRSSLTEQVLLAGRISRLTRGWMHSYVPFCPFKQVAFNRGLTLENPMALVKDAILNHGHIGVKFYPPMGFRPLGNEVLPVDFWNQSPLVEGLKRPFLGRDLDDALGALYAFCHDNDVSIMAHTSPTNVTVDKYKTEIMDPVYWKPVFAREGFPGLRVNFGHFGNTDILASGDTNAKGLMDLMTTGAGSPGERLYADSAFFAEVLSQSGRIEAELATLLRGTPLTGGAPLSERLMYGTDWEMVVIEGKLTTGYFDDFQVVFDRLAARPGLDPKGDLVNRFFGLNAVDYLGLRPGQLPRQRLDAFHRGRPQPAWMAKLGTRTA